MVIGDSNAGMLAVQHVADHPKRPISEKARAGGKNWLREPNSIATCRHSLAAASRISSCSAVNAKRLSSQYWPIPAERVRGYIH
jgi:hypothetical protein